AESVSAPIGGLAPEAGSDRAPPGAAALPRWIVRCCRWLDGRKPPPSTVRATPAPQLERVRNAFDPLPSRDDPTGSITQGGAAQFDTWQLAQAHLGCVAHRDRDEWERRAPHRC